MQILGAGRYLRLLKRGRWEYVERVNARGAVIIVALTPAGELLLVEQPRPATGGCTLELPAGLLGDVDAHEPLEETARRELLEETGWTAQRVALLCEGPATPGMSSERISFVWCSGLQQLGHGGGVDGEEITVHAIQPEKIPQWLAEQQARGLAIDPKIYTGLYYVSLRAPSKGA